MSGGVGFGTVPRIGSWLREPVGVLMPERRGRAALIGIGLIVFSALALWALVDAPPGGVADRRGPIVRGAVMVGIPLFALAGLAALRSAIRPGGVALLPEGVFVARPSGRVLVPWTAIADVTVHTATRYRGPGSPSIPDISWPTSMLMGSPG